MWLVQVGYFLTGAIGVVYGLIRCGSQVSTGIPIVLGGAFSLGAAYAIGEVIELRARVDKLVRDAAPPAPPVRSVERADPAPAVAPVERREPTADEIEAAKALLKTAQDHHFEKRFVEARAIYAELVARFGNTKQAATARQQLENLGKA